MLRRHAWAGIVLPVRLGFESALYWQSLPRRFNPRRVGQPPDPFFVQGAFPPVVQYPSPAYGASAPMFAQYAPGQGADAAQPSEGTPPPKPEEKKEAEKSDKDEKKGGKDAKQEDKDEKKDDKDEKKDEKEVKVQNFNFHAQTTFVAQGDPGFPAQYSGPNSLNSAGERQSTVTADLYAGLRLWRGAEVHADFLAWEGYGLSQTFGIEDFTNGDAYKAGTTFPDFMAAHLFVRQSFGLGGEQEDVPDGPFTLAGKQDISRLTFTVGRLSPTDMFEDNTYAHDPHTQFMNWATNTNVTWDYASDQVGFTTGIAVELNQAEWALRYGFFQMPGVQNGFTADDRIFCWPGQGSDGSFFQSWGMAMEVERRWSIDGHKGAIRFLAWLNEADMASYQVATAILRKHPPGSGGPPGSGADVPPASLAIRNKHGLGLNWEQEIAKNVGLFSRVGWNDGHEEAWTYTDVNWTASLGVSVKGPLRNLPKRKDDTWGLVGIVSGASHDQQEFLEAGGLGILNGDGALSYSPEKVLETYYSFQLDKSFQLMLDYEYVDDPAFNSARGPVSVFGARVHWEY